MKKFLSIIFILLLSFWSIWNTVSATNNLEWTKSKKEFLKQIIISKDHLEKSSKLKPYIKKIDILIEKLEKIKLEKLLNKIQKLPKKSRNHPIYKNLLDYLEAKVFFKILTLIWKNTQLEISNLKNININPINLYTVSPKMQGHEIRRLSLDSNYLYQYIVSKNFELPIVEVGNVIILYDSKNIAHKFQIKEINSQNGMKSIKGIGLNNNNSISYSQDKYSLSGSMTIGKDDYSFIIISSGYGYVLKTEEPDDAYYEE